MERLPEQRYKENVDDIVPIEFLEINGDVWRFIKSRPFTKTEIYTVDNGSKYLHIGDNEIINSEAECIKNLHGLNFPVPTILESGQINSRGYYVETSVGIESYASKFRNECSKGKKISTETYGLFCEMSCRFLDSQLKASLGNTYTSDIEVMTNLSIVMKENPDLNTIQVSSCIEKIQNRIERLPSVYSHGDLTPRNVFEAGVIDFEFNSIEPVGLDILTSPLVENLWAFKNTEGQTHEEFIINAEQLSIYFNMINTTAKNNGVDNFLEFIDDFILIKTFWSLAYEKKQAISSGNPSKWNFRKCILNYCMKQYLNDEVIDAHSFKHFDTK